MNTSIKKSYFYNNINLPSIEFKDSNGIIVLKFLEENLTNKTHILLQKNNILSTFNTYILHKKYYSNDFNKLNYLYYSNRKLAYKSDQGLAKIYNDCIPLNLAIANFIKQNIKSTKIKIKEFGFGNKFKAWEIIANNLESKQITLLASDIEVPQSIPKLPSNLNIKLQKENILSHFSHTQKKFDILMTTYGFDSIWFEDDLHIIKSGNSYYQKLFKFNVLSNYPNKQLIFDSLTNPGLALKLITEDYQNIVFEEICTEFDINNHKYGQFIKNRFEKDPNLITMNFPGGLISKVKESFVTQLVTDGIFISGDVSVHSVNQDIVVNPCEFSGNIARYKVEDYLIAKQILESEGYKVTIYPFPDLVDKFLQKNWEVSALVSDIHLLKRNFNNVLFVVEKNG